MTNRIRQLRKERNISQERLADLLNTGRSTITKLERGERRLDVDWMNRMAGVFNCEPWHLIADPEEARAPSLDIEFLSRVLEGVCRHVDLMGYDWSPQDIAETVAEFYAEHFSRREGLHTPESIDAVLAATVKTKRRA